MLVKRGCFHASFNWDLQACVIQEEELSELIEHKADETIWLRMRRLCPHTAMYLSPYTY
jgi:hypothetical protein